MLLLVWIFTVVPLDPSAPAPPPASFETLTACNTARETFIQDHMTTNWQGLKMAPLINTFCKPEDR